MGRILPLWLEIWLIASSIICAIDISYTMLRPLTVRNGKLGDLYYLWNIYADVDVRYASTSDLTTMATGRCMLLEILLNIVALIMDRRYSRHTLLTAFTTSTLVCWKTVIYLCQYIMPVEGNIDYITPGTPIWKTIFVFWIPNSVWVVIPFIAMIQLWNRLAVPVAAKQLSNAKLVPSDDDEDSERSSLSKKIPEDQPIDV